MPGYRLNPRPKVASFFAVDVTEESGDLPRAANDNSCPYCGGVLEPGDKASDCSGSKSRPPSKAWPMMPFPQGWEASC
jgi:hypothetical protein